MAAASSVACTHDDGGAWCRTSQPHLDEVHVERVEESLRTGVWTLGLDVAARSRFLRMLSTFAAGQQETRTRLKASGMRRLVVAGKGGGEEQAGG